MRNYEIVKIDDVEFQLRQTRSGGKKIGKVHVLVIKTFKDIADALDNDLLVESLVVSDFVYGLAVRLQGMARVIASGSAKLTDTEKNRIWQTIPEDERLELMNDYSAMQKRIAEVWTKEQEEKPTEFNESYIYDRDIVL